MKLINTTKKMKLARVVFDSAALLLVVFSMLTIMPIYDATPSADATGDEDPAEPTITVNTVNSTAAVNIALNDLNGTFAQSAENEGINFNVTTNNVTGYSLSVVTGDGSAQLSNGEYALDSVDSILSATDFDTAAHNNQWGIRPSRYVDLDTNAVVDNDDESVFLPAPASARLLDKTSAPNTTANDYSIAIGMRVDISAAAGEYNNTLDIVAVSNLVPKYLQTTRYRYENVDGTFTDWIIFEEKEVSFGSTYSWSPSDITGFDGAPYQEVTPLNYVVDDVQTNEITFMRKTFTVTKRYKLEDADGNYPEEFTEDGTLSVRYGESQTYTKAVDFYITGEVEEQEITDSIYLDLLLERRKYPVYIQKGNNDIETISSDGSYRWGQIITVTGTSYADNNCSDYGEVTWSRSGFGTFVDNNTTGSTVQYEVGRGTATLRAWGTHEDIPQTITFSAPNGETITFDGVDYHDGDTTQAICSTFDLSTTIKEQPVEERIYLQDITPATCPTTKTRVYDRRDEESYYIQKLADGNCWLLDNLRLDSATATTLTTTNTNMSPVYNFTLPETWPINSGYSYQSLVLPRITTNFKNVGLAPWWHADKGTFGGDGYYLNTTYTVEDSATISFAEVSRTGVYYNFCAATAGTWCKDNEGADPEDFVSDGHIYDICPAGWRLPTGGAGSGEYANLRSSYSDVEEFKDAFNVRLGSGMVNGVNTQWNQRNIGYYWSGSPYMHIYGYYLATWKDGGTNDGFNDRYAGHAVRCMIPIPAEPEP